MPSEPPETNRGRSVDSAPLPDWARPYFSPEQLGLDRGLLWVLLVFKARNLGDSATNLAQRYYIHSVGKAAKRAWPSVRVLAADLELSTNTVMAAQRTLESHGWLVKSAGPGGRTAYTLAWPLHDCLAPTEDGPVLCGAFKVGGSLCTRRAGWGTAHQGEGRCKLHEPELSQPLRHPNGEPEADASQPLRGAVATTATPMSQPLRQGVATIETEYVSECVSGVHQMSNPGLPHAVAEVEVPPATSEPDEDRDVIDEGEWAVNDGSDPPAVEGVEPKHLTALPEACEHGRPGGYLPRQDHDPGLALNPVCGACRGHAAICRDPLHCPKCQAIRQAAGLDVVPVKEIA